MLIGVSKCTGMNESEASSRHANYYRTKQSNSEKSHPPPLQKASPLHMSFTHCNQKNWLKPPAIFKDTEGMW